MFTITKDFHFSAAHHLEGLPEDHQCARVHGHNYVVRVELAAELLDDVGFVLDYGDLAHIAGYLDNYLDHRDLNEVLDTNPTAENLAAHLWSMLAPVIPTPANCVGIGVSETPKTWAWYRP